MTSPCWLGAPNGSFTDSCARRCKTSFANRVCEAELWSVDQIGGWQSQYGRLAQIQPIDTEGLQQQALARFRALATYANGEIANLREGLRRGYAAPRGNLEKVITQMDGFAAESSPYFGPAERTKSPAFATAWREMVRSELAPAFRRYETFLRDEYLARARENVAVSALPDGEACYRARLREMTTLSITAEEVHRTGLEELERIKAEERAIATRLFNTPDLADAFAQLERPQHRWETRDAVIAYARTAATRAAAAMPRWFGRLPKTSVIVTPVPVVEEPTTADQYQPGTIDGKRPGEYQINAGQWVGNRKADLEATVQATAYMIGALEIERLRAEAQQRLGSRFDPKRFHDAVLEDGSLPLPMLRAKMRTLQ